MQKLTSETCLMLSARHRWPDVIIWCLLVYHVSLRSTVCIAATGEQRTGFNLFFQIISCWGNSCSITRAFPLTSIPRNRSHQLPSLPFKTAAQSFLLNAFCPFSKAPHLTKTWVSSPCQSCTPGWPCVPCSKPRYVHKERVYGKTNGSWPASRKAVVFQFLLQWLVFKNHGCQAPEYYTCI